ncbi:MAG: ATP-dependent Clp protease ATP-binding subunit [Planctomycetota bacterium]|nr:MAG: ATP-dependent Clp protease ATP-binding subunit [Planctomycetota bacterium]
MYKYFDLIDGFIRVRILSNEEQLPMPVDDEGRPLDRREYRRLVVRACVVDVEESVLPRVRQIYPEDSAAAEDLLYQICVDVNPRLEIHTVALPARAGGADGAAEDPATELRRRAAVLESRLREEIVGQDDHVATVARAVRKAAAGLNDPRRPMASFLMVGRTGVGKTELAKALARHLYGEDSLVRIDCSEYALPHETAKLIGAPPGYVGHNEGGTLTEALMNDPRAVVLFDEVEKGHEKLHNMLLQILDDGRLTDSKGNTVSFRDTVVLLTSNVGTADYREAANRVGFGRTGALAEADFVQLTHEAIRRNFKPELINRLDQVLVFHPLDRRSCARIAEMKLREVAERLERIGVELSWTPRAVTALADAGYSEDYGAREVRRTVARLVEEPLSNQVLDGEIGCGARIVVRWRGGEVLLDRAAEPPRRRSA